MTATATRPSVLGLRRIRRSQNVQGQTQADVSRGAAGALVDEQSQDRAPVRKQSRKRPLDAVATRGQSKIGRAAHLRPGRLTFGLNDAKALLAGGQRSSTAPGLFEESTTAARDRSASEGSCGWQSDEHSQHSSWVHCAEKGGKENLPREQAPEREAAEHYLYDFWARNPAAKANGWLSLSHHRYVPDCSRAHQSSAMTRAARVKIRSQHRQVLGLLPTLGPARKRR